MSRTSKGPRYYQSLAGGKGGYVANINGERIRLLVGVPDTKANEKEAKRLYEQEKDIRSVQTEGDKGPVWALANDYLNWMKNRTKPPPATKDTIVLKKHYLDSFITYVGKLAIRDVRPDHLDGWLAEMSKERVVANGLGTQKVQWTEGGQQLALSILKAMFRWGKKRGVISNNPFDSPAFEDYREDPNYRSKKVDISEAEHRALVLHNLRYRDKEFPLLLMFLQATGARPAEIHQAKSKEWDEAKCYIVIKADDPENRGRFKLLRKRKDRIIRIPPDLVPLVELLREKTNDGLLFHAGGNRGKKKAWDKQKLVARIRRTIKAVNKDGSERVRHEVSAYSYRHAFVTRWLEAGEDTMHLCALLGTSIEVIQKHYSHLSRKDQVLQDSLNRFSEAQRAVPSSGVSAAAVGNSGALRREGAVPPLV